MRLRTLLKSISYFNRVLMSLVDVFSLADSLYKANPSNRERKTSKLLGQTISGIDCTVSYELADAKS